VGETHAACFHYYVKAPQICLLPVRVSARASDRINVFQEGRKVVRSIDINSGDIMPGAVPGPVPGSWISARIVANPKAAPDLNPPIATPKPEPQVLRQQKTFRSVPASKFQVIHYFSTTLEENPRNEQGHHGVVPRCRTLARRRIWH